MIVVDIAFQSKFNAWLDSKLNQPIPENVVAFSFNLAEPWSIEFVGTATYSKNEPDWACEEVFRPEGKDLDLPESEVGLVWEAVLEEAKQMVLVYLKRPSCGSEVLRKSCAVGVGFVDGELHEVWPICNET